MLDMTCCKCLDRYETVRIVVLTAAVLFKLVFTSSPLRKILTNQLLLFSARR